MARLALLIPNLGLGGAERVTLLLAESFLARGHEVDLVTLQLNGALVGAVPKGVRVFDLGVTRTRRAIRPVIKYLRDRRPDAVHAAIWPLTIVAIVAAWLGPVKPRVVVSDHSILSRQYAASRTTMAVLKWTTRLFYSRADARVCVSMGCAADLSSLSGLPFDAFTVIYNPVKPPQQTLDSDLLEALWGEARHRIITVGNLKEAKRHEVLIRAFARINAALSAKLIIIGEGERRTALQELIDDLGLTGRVLLPGFAADPSPYYSSAHLFVLSSDREGLSNVIIEALLAGLPVVSTDCETGPREILDGGRYGRLVPVNDVEALADAIGQALHDQHDPEPGRKRALLLTSGSTERYLKLMLGEALQ